MISPVFPNIVYGFEVEAKGARKPIYRQVHGNEIVEIRDEAHRDEYIANSPSADGAYTLKSGLELYVFTADCLPILFFSKEPTGPIATIHCGWRGAKAGIATAAADLLSPMTSELHVVLGPSIMGCCFEVRQDFVREFEEAPLLRSPRVRHRHPARAVSRRENSSR